MIHVKQLILEGINLKSTGREVKPVNKYISKLAVMLVLSILLQSCPGIGTVKGASTSELAVIIHNAYSIQLVWNDYLTNEQGFYIDKKIDSGSFTELGAIGPSITSYYDVGISPGHTYTYRIRVTDSSGVNYTYTNELTFHSDDVVRPDSLTVTPVSSDQVDLKWSYPDQKAYNTMIERRQEDDMTWHKLANVPVGQNTYSDKDIAPGIKYYYKIRSYSIENVRSYAYPDEYIGTGAYNLLYKPTEFYGYVLVQNQIRLNWKDNSIETAFIIERKGPEDGDFKQIAVVPQNEVTYLDTDSLKPNSTYLYRIKAVINTSYSEYSDIISVTNIYLRAPGTLSSTYLDGESVNLYWSDLTDNETGFEIWRKVDIKTDDKTDNTDDSDNEWKLYDTMGRNATTYRDLGVSSQQNYTYKVRARINSNSVYSDFTNETVIWTSKIDPPTNLKFKAVGKTQIELTWQDVSSIEAGYVVERRQGDMGKWYDIASLDPNTVKYTDKWADSTDVYYYRIRVFDKSNAVNYSNEIIAVNEVPQAPSNLKAEVISSSEVLITWQDNSDTENEFVIESMQFYSFKEIGRVSSNTTRYACNNITPGSTVTFRVKAVNGFSESSYTDGVAATTRSSAAYSDLSSVQWAVTAINSLTDRKVFDTAENSKFYPNQNISRGEFCSIVVRSFGLDKVTAGRFADVTSKHRYYKEIMAAAKLGIISADSNNKIYPDKAVTREQAAIMLSLALKINGTPLPVQDTSTLRQFADYRSVPDASAAKIAAVCSAGIISGRSVNGKNYLQLSSNVTRAEAAVMTYKAIYIK